MFDQSYDTIIVGLGAAGATAASVLGRAGKKVLALEAQDYIGGRVRTVPFGQGVVELGAEWVHGSKPSRVYDIAVQNNITLVPQDLVLMPYFSDGVKADEDFQCAFNEFLGFLFETGFSSSEEPEPLGRYVTRKFTEYLQAEKPEFLQDEAQVEMILEYMNQMSNNYNASNDWNDINSKGDYEELEGHNHLSWHRLGYKTFFQLLMNKEEGYPTVDVKLKTEVAHITWPKDPTEKVAVTCSKSGTVYKADQVICTISLGVLKERHLNIFRPRLPKEKINAIETLAMGVMDKIDLTFDEIWWPLDAVFFAFLWKEEDTQSVPEEDLWTTKVFSASRPLGSKNVLTMWTSGEVAKLVETLPVHDVKKKCRDILQRFMGGKNFTVPEPTYIKRSTWFSNPYTRGSYSYDHIKAADYPTARADLAAPLLDAAGKPRVYFAGEATDLTHYSTVHGASDTGHRAAMSIIDGDKWLSKL